MLHQRTSFFYMSFVTIQHGQGDIVQWGPAPLYFEIYKSNGASPIGLSA
jgi:hypothetical protein